MGRGIAGFFQLIGIDIILFIFGSITNFTSAAMFIGLVQLVYVIPICIFKWKKDKQYAQGMIIGASVVFIINSLCWGLLSNL